MDNLAVVITRLRERIEQTEKADPVTQDLFMAARLEQLHWMWQAQSATAPSDQATIGRPVPIG